MLASNHLQKQYYCQSTPFLTLLRSSSTETDQSESSTESQPQPQLPLKEKKQTRFRQHVNPLSRKFQAPVELSDNWSNDVFDDPTLKLHLDIGCGKGGFLLDLATHEKKKEKNEDLRNYLGLEIRPGVAEYAMNRVNTPHWNLSGQVYFIQCNANVDLDRILTDYTGSDHTNDLPKGSLNSVSIQFPDPHFKTQHKKRRVVNADFIHVLAKYMDAGTQVFLQSDIQEVLDDMRERFREFPQYYTDQIDNVQEYMEENPFGVPTEREVSVLKQGLPVYRTIFTRTTTEKINEE